MFLFYSESNEKFIDIDVDTKSSEYFCSNIFFGSVYSIEYLSIIIQEIIIGFFIIQIEKNVMFVEHIFFCIKESYLFIYLYL